MGLSRANVDFLVANALAEALPTPPPVDYEQWAVNNISFADRELQFAGPYNPNRFKPFSEIYKALSPFDPCRIVTLSKGAQIGGTVIATVFCLGSLDLDPGDFLYVHPTEENARRWSRLKLAPMLRGSPRLREIFPEKARDGADSVMFKERADYRGSHLKANSIVNWFVALFHELGYEGCSSHSGRRSFITMATRNVRRSRCSLRDVQLLAGRRSIETTERYIDGDTCAQWRLVAYV